MKQPRPLTGPSAFILGCTIGNWKGCVLENGWCFFPWSCKGITGKMPWLWIPPRGNLEKKAAFSPCCGDEATIYYDRATGKKPVFPPCCGGKTTTCYMTEPKYKIWLCLSLWLIQDSNWKGRVLWKLSGGLATILQNWISCNEQKMREAHITRRGMNFYLLIFIEKNH